MKIYLAGVKWHGKIDKNAKHVMYSYYYIQKLPPWRRLHSKEEDMEEFRDDMLQEIKRRIKDEK
jgi:hypothetical protein